MTRTRFFSSLSSPPAMKTYPKKRTARPTSTNVMYWPMTCASSAMTPSAARTMTSARTATPAPRISFPTLLPRLYLRVGVPGRVHADVAERPARARGEDREADEHPDARRAEAPVPPDGLAEEARHDLAEEGAEVDAHVEDRESGVAPRPALWVEVADDGRDVRLEQPRAADD